MLKLPEHQVAGHFATATELGPLIDGAGLFYKPLQSSERGSTELSFYSNPQIPPKIHHRFFPKFHGTTLHNNHPHLILEDLTSDLTRPSVIDFKIGSRTWAPTDPEPYFKKCIAKDRVTTSLSLGFRISGLTIRDNEEALYKPDRDEVRRFDADDVRKSLRRFGKKKNEVMEGLLEELVDLKEWFEEQTIWHFYSASLLVMYEEGMGKARVKMVDFAHVVDAGGVIDHNFVGGVCSLIKFVKEVIVDFDDGKVDVENEK